MSVTSKHSQTSIFTETSRGNLVAMACMALLFVYERCAPRPAAAATSATATATTGALALSRHRCGASPSPPRAYVLGASVLLSTAPRKWLDGGCHYSVARTGSVICETVR